MGEIRVGTGDGTGSPDASWVNESFASIRADKAIKVRPHSVHHFSPEDDARIARLSAFHESIELEGTQNI